MNGEIGPVADQNYETQNCILFVITGRQEAVAICFWEPIMSKKKITANHLISIDARLRSRYSTVSVKAETAECPVA